MIANIIYTKSKDLNLVDFAIKINKGEEVDIAKTELEAVKELCIDEKSGLVSFARKAIRDFIDSKNGK